MKNSSIKSSDSVCLSGWKTEWCWATRKISTCFAPYSLKCFVSLCFLISFEFRVCDGWFTHTLNVILMFTGEEAECPSCIGQGLKRGKRERTRIRNHWSSSLSAHTLSLSEFWPTAKVRVPWERMLLKIRSREQNKSLWCDWYFSWRSSTGWSLSRLLSLDLSSLGT